MNKIKMIALIDDQGIILNKTGFADYDAQEIYDANHQPFPAGIDESGKLYCISADADNTVLNNNGKRIGWNAFCRISGVYLSYLKKQVNIFNQ